MNDHDVVIVKKMFQKHVQARARDKVNWKAAPKTKYKSSVEIKDNKKRLGKFAKTWFKRSLRKVAFRCNRWKDW